MTPSWLARSGRAIVFVLATLWLLVVLIPLYYMVLATFRSQSTYLTANPWLPKGGLTLSTYRLVFGAGEGRYLLNSVIVSVTCIALTVTLSLLAAFRVVRNKTRGAGSVLKLFLFGLAVPQQAIIVPLYLLVVHVHLYDKLEGLILVMSAAAIPVSVFIMVGFVRDIPPPLIEAMQIDGASEWRVFWRLIWPLSRPVLATLAIYNGLNVWNNFLLPLVLTQSTSNAVLPLGLYKFQGQFGVNVPAIMAAVLVSMLPLVVLFASMRRQVIQGLGGLSLR
jgi:raffinose/stachyose/melibiose transport system permease protein